jgi:protoheme ferro-lyase
MPYGFLADNAESQLEGRVALRAHPSFAGTLHLPCLNDSPELSALLAGSIVAGEAVSNAQPRSASGT